MASDDLVAAIAKLSAADREKLRTRAKAPVADVTPPKPAPAGRGPKIGSDVLARWAAKGHDRYGRRLGNMRWETSAPDSDPLADWDSE
jgi:hypothetical protein